MCPGVQFYRLLFLWHSPRLITPSVCCSSHLAGCSAPERLLFYDVSVLLFHGARWPRTVSAHHGTSRVSSEPGHTQSAVLLCEFPILSLAFGNPLSGSPVSFSCSY